VEDGFIWLLTPKNNNLFFGATNETEPTTD
jgi:hypothetical protein